MFKLLSDKDLILKLQRENSELNAENIELKSKVEANLIATRSMIRVDDLTEDELAEMVDLYDEYEVGKSYVIGDILKLEGKLYKVVQDHTSQADWIPISTKALYTELMPENVIPNWKQPEGDTGNYFLGSRVIHNGQTWESTHDGNNVWEPGVYGWIVV